MPGREAEQGARGNVGGGWTPGFKRPEVSKSKEARGWCSVTIPREKWCRPPELGRQDRDASSRP